MLNRGLMSSDRPDWNTPLEVLTPIRLFGRIALDPCSNENSIVGAAREYRLDRGEDGLVLPWTGHSLVYVNPPYGREIGAWVDKAAVSGASSGADIIMLVPARTDASWFHRAARTAQALCLWRGRLRFLGAPSSAPFPSALIYWGSGAPWFNTIFQTFGLVFDLGGK
jgi:phage N-6-adenine-methyltransferase